MDNHFKNLNFIEKVKYICSITVKNDGRALDIIFILCLISIIALCIFLYRSSTHFYERLDETMKNNISLNIETTRNEQLDKIQILLNQIDLDTDTSPIETSN